MRTKISTLLALAVLTMAGTVSLHASADSIATKLSQARRERDRAVATYRKAERRLQDLMTQYRAAQVELDDVAAQITTAYTNQQNLAGALADAQRSLDQAAAQAYKNGPGATIEVLLDTTTPSDVAAAEEFASRAFEVGSETVQRVEDLRISLQVATEDLEKREGALQTTTKLLADLAGKMETEVQRARDAAQKARLKVNRLEQQERELERAQAALGSQLANLFRSQRYASLMQRLALLGPNQGRGCDIPPSLRDTGQRMAGLASWYGDDTITATGDPFDPNLFTAANKELPLNVYIRVHYNGKCAILLVNDRGPYGYGRVFDLSEGAATYLGYWSAGVVWVTADVLVPASS